MGLLGLAARAGAVAPGQEAALDRLGRGKAHLVLVAADAGQAVVGKFQRQCAAKRVPMFLIAGKAALGLAIGRSPRVAVAVLDKHLAAGIEKALAGAPGRESGKRG